MSARHILAVFAFAVLAVSPVAAMTTAQPAAAETVAQPAEEAPAPVPVDESQPWTARYLAPTVLAMAAVVLVLVVLFYVVRVRGRYRVVR